MKALRKESLIYMRRIITVGIKFHLTKKLKKNRENFLTTILILGWQRFYTFKFFE